MSWKIALLTTLVALSSADQYCRGLALGGGNDLGAFQAGAIVGLLKKLPVEETNYQIVTGLGVGAINALIVGKYNNTQNAQLEEELSEFWLSSRRGDFNKDWLFGRLDGYLKHSGLFDSSPMNKTIGQLMKGISSYRRPFHVSATDLVTGHLITFNSTLSHYALQTGIYASASAYVQMPIVKYNELLLTEGSIRYTADILGVINYCIGQGYNESDIIVDTIFTQYSDLDVVDASKYKTIEVVARVAQIYNYDNINTSIEVAINTFPNAKYRYILRPTSKQIGGKDESTFDYSKKDLSNLYQTGLREAELTEETRELPR